MVSIKDYISQPKSNGYRSYHMIVEVPVFFLQKKEYMRVEVQLRTVAMNFWATLEHQIKNKSKSTKEVEIVDTLRDCADIIADTDKRMLQIREYTNKEK